MRPIALTVVALCLLAMPTALHAQTSARTLVAVLAHADDEVPAAPMLARYAREGVKVYLLVATDGGEGTGFARARGDSVPRGQELVRMRTDEARCAATALGVESPILLSFPDGRLGDYISDRTLGYRLTAQIAGELERLRPDAIVTWGPDGGTGHPDHRIISNIVMQLQRAGAPGVPERIFHMYMPAEGIRVVSPQRREPPLLVPDSRLVTVRVPYRPEDFVAAKRSMLCHRSQFTPEVVERVVPVMTQVWNGTIPLIPAFSSGPLSDVFGGPSRR